MIKTALIAAAVIIAVLVVLAVLALFTPASQLAPWANMTPEELAERHVNDKIDAIGETIAGVLLLQAPILSELGGEFIEDRIHDVIKWRYAAARDLGGGRYSVVATASVGFEVEIALTSVGVALSLPFDMTVDHDAQTVTRMEPNIAAMSLDLDAPALKDASEAVDAATEKASEVAGQAAEAVDEATEKASEIVDEASEKASEAAGQAAEAASEKISEIGGALDSEDCLGAAREAGVPERVLSILEKPSDERGSLERSLARRALDAVGLSEACADLAE